MKDYNYYVYILTNFNNKVMYIGVTNNLERRLYEHKNGIFEGFTKKYNVKKLVYFEETNNIILSDGYINDKKCLLKLNNDNKTNNKKNNILIFDNLLFYIAIELQGRKNKKLGIGPNCLYGCFINENGLSRVYAR